MSERLNFYDVYGYLIPGLGLVILAWLPLGLANARLPEDKLSAAAISVVVAYVLGLFLATLTNRVFTGQIGRRADGIADFPAVTLLDKATELADPIKRRLADNVRDQFEIDVKWGVDADETIARDRRAAYFLCRPFVNKATAYAEQFQGLYAMMIGLTTVFGLGFFYNLGWYAATSSWDGSTTIKWTLWIAVLATLALSVQQAPLARIARPVAKDVANTRRARRVRRFLGWTALGALGLIALCAGYCLETLAAIPPEREPLLLLGGALYLAAALRFFSAYRFFAQEHAKAVWMYFPSASEQKKASA